MALTPQERADKIRNHIIAMESQLQAAQSELCASAADPDASIQTQIAATHLTASMRGFYDMKSSLELVAINLPSLVDPKTMFGSS